MIVIIPEVFMSLSQRKEELKFRHICFLESGRILILTNHNLFQIYDSFLEKLLHEYQLPEDKKKETLPNESYRDRWDICLEFGNVNFLKKDFDLESVSCLLPEGPLLAHENVRDKVASLSQDDLFTIRKLNDDKNLFSLLTEKAPIYKERFIPLTEDEYILRRRHWDKKQDREICSLNFFKKNYDEFKFDKSLTFAPFRYYRPISPNEIVTISPGKIDFLSREGKQEFVLAGRIRPSFQTYDQYQDLGPGCSAFYSAPDNSLICIFPRTYVVHICKLDLKSRQVCAEVIYPYPRSRGTISYFHRMIQSPDGSLLLLEIHQHDTPDYRYNNFYNYLIFDPVSMSLITVPLQLNIKERICDISNQYRILVSNDTSCRVFEVPELNNYLDYIKSTVHTAIDKELSILPKDITSLVAVYVNTDVKSLKNPASFFSQSRIEVAAEKPSFEKVSVEETNGKCCAVM